MSSLDPQEQYKMNILFLALDVNLTHRTGDSIHVRELARSLAIMGNKVLLITADPGEPGDIEWGSGTPNLQMFFTSSGRGLSDVSTVRFCKKVAKKHDAHIIYERRTSPKIGYALHKLLKIPYVVEINAIVEEEKALLSGDDDNASFKGFRKNMRTRFFQEAALVIAVTEGIKDHLHNLYDLPKERIAVVPNGANTELFKPMDRENCIRELGLDPNKRYICFTGNLAPWQGLIHMIDAMPLILKKKENAGFLIVGGGKEKEALERRAGELNLEGHVIFSGWVEYENVPVYINASDVCVAPLAAGRERSGSSALKIFEYLACAKPVVSTDLPGLEFLKDTQCGMVVPKGDISLLADSVSRLLSKNDIRVSMGKNGRKIVEDKYSWDSTARMIIEKLEKIK
jgi:glycosyltransferase involved in cell wall biosynthesis